MPESISQARRRRRTVLGVLFTLLVLAVLCIGTAIWMSFTYGIDDGYAQWGAAEMVIDYLETHDGAWPRSWDDLQPQFDADKGRVGWTYDRFQDRIGINFDADPDLLRRESLESRSATFCVVWPKSWFAANVGDDPNQRLCDYFRRKAGIVDPEPPLPEGFVPPTAVPVENSGT